VRHSSTHLVSNCIGRQPCQHIGKATFGDDRTAAARAARTTSSPHQEPMEPSRNVVVYSSCLASLDLERIVFVSECTTFEQKKVTRHGGMTVHG
jgi:hypothetical protein